MYTLIIYASFHDGKNYYTKGYRCVLELPFMPQNMLFTGLLRDNLVSSIEQLSWNLHLNTFEARLVGGITHLELEEGINERWRKI